VRTWWPPTVHATNSRWRATSETRPASLDETGAFDAPVSFYQRIRSNSLLERRAHADAAPIGLDRAGQLGLLAVEGEHLQLLLVSRLHDDPLVIAAPHRALRPGADLRGRHQRELGAVDLEDAHQAVIVVGRMVLVARRAIVQDHGDV